MLDALPPLLPDLRELYEDLHAHPELSFAEHRTAGTPGRHGSRRSATRSPPGWAPPGVVAVMANGDGPRVLLRADIDALPVAEATGLPYASTVTTTDRGRPRGAGRPRLRARHARHLDDRGRHPARRPPRRLVGHGHARAATGRGGRRRRRRHGRRRALRTVRAARRGARPTRGAGPGRHGVQPRRHDDGGQRRGAHHPARSWRPRLGPPPVGRPGGHGRLDHPAAQHHRVARAAPGRHRRRHRRHRPGGDQGEHHQRPRRPDPLGPHLRAARARPRARCDQPHRRGRVADGRSPQAGRGQHPVLLPRRWPTTPTPPRP